MGSPKAPRSRRSATVFFMAFLTIAIIVGLLVTSLIPGLVLREQQSRQLASLDRQLAGIKAENTRLREDLARLSDPAHIEVLARSRYNLVKKGERLYRVIDVPTKETTRAVASPKAVGWWERTWQWLLDSPSKLRF